MPRLIRGVIKAPRAAVSENGDYVRGRGPEAWPTPPPEGARVGYAPKFADGWNGAYIGPEEWIHKSKVLDDWCEKEGRNPTTILRSVNIGFYMGADAKGAARGEEILRRHWGDRANERTGWLRGTPKDVIDMVAGFRDAGCVRFNIAFREGPYDWDALHAFAEQVMPAFGAKRP